MDITLTTPIDPGSMDPGQTYNKVRIVFISIDPLLPCITLTLEVGCYLEGSWRRGLPLRRNVVVDASSTPSYEAIKALPTLDGELFEDAMLRSLYSAVQSVVPEYAGTVG
jgi:hypothetical protein